MADQTTTEETTPPDEEHYHYNEHQDLATGKPTWYTIHFRRLATQEDAKTIGES